MEAPKTAVIRYATTNGIEMKADQIDEVIKLQGKRASPFKSDVVRSSSEKDRDTFIEAKFAAIKRRKEIQAVISNLRQSGTESDLALAETKKANELDPLSKVRIQEDFMPRRHSMLRAVKGSDMVRNAYTQNGVI